MKVNCIQNNVNPNFQARLVLSKEIKSKTLKQAGEYLSKITNDEKNLYMKRDKLGYSFSLDSNLASQTVGRDTLGYLLAEKTPEEIAKFLKTTIKAIESRAKYGKEYRCTDIDNPARAAAEIYKQDETIGKELLTLFENKHEDNLTLAGDVIHVWA